MIHLKEKLEHDAEKFNKQLESKKILADYKKIQFQINGLSQSQYSGTQVSWALLPVINLLTQLSSEADNLKWKYKDAETKESKLMQIEWFANKVYDLIESNQSAINRLKELDKSFRFSDEEIEDCKKEFCGKKK